MYQYRITEIKSVYDGDTITCEVDLGFGVRKMEKFRLSHINAPELRQPTLEEGRKSRNYLKKRLQEAMDNDIPIIVKTSKDRKGKYGRYLANIFINGKSVNDDMITHGFAELYK